MSGPVSYSSEHGWQEDGPGVANRRHLSAVDGRIASTLKAHLCVVSRGLVLLLGAEGIVLMFRCGSVSG